MYVEAKRAGREGEFYVFHLGWPDISARYNAVGRFGRISEVATRIAGQLSVKATRRVPRVRLAVCQHHRPRPGRSWGSARLPADPAPRHQHRCAVHRVRPALLRQERAESLGGHRPARSQAERQEHPAQHDRARERVVALEQYLSQVRIYDPVLDGLRSAVRYDRTYFDKIVRRCLPLLEKLTTGKIAQLLAPNYSGPVDPRPIFDWMQIIRKRAVVYVGLDALSDAEVAAAVGNSMFSDLVSVAGHIYKFGIDDGLPGASARREGADQRHADEFNEN